MVKISKVLVSVMPIAIIASCSLFSRTIYVKIPDHYSGWCYLIPVSDTSIVSPKSGRTYILNEMGVAHIPKEELDLKKTYIIKIFSNEGEITGEDQYTGVVQKVTENGTKYDYVQFYIPRSEERGIKDSEYWRNKGSQHRASQPFDSLVNKGIIKF